jgi:hypothetical protein
MIDQKMDQGGRQDQMATRKEKMEENKILQETTNFVGRMASDNSQ